jgi:hypothetical protein
VSQQETVRYQDPRSVLVVSHKGLLRQVFVPIKLLCVEGVEQIPVGSYVFADAVFLHKKYRLLYWICGRLIPYHFFTIPADW